MTCLFMLRPFGFYEYYDAESGALLGATGAVWEGVKDVTGIRLNVTGVSDFEDMIDGVANGGVDAFLTPLAICCDRHLNYTYSLPMYTRYKN